MLGNKSNKKFYRSGGTRGGQDQFKWENVKYDKDRESYLGHSIHAAVGRWQQGKDILWYTREKNSLPQSIQEEREMARQMDNELLNEALGLQTKKTRTSQLSRDDMNYLMSKGKMERDDYDIERVQGLGAASSRGHDHIEKISAIQKEINKLKHDDSQDSLKPKNYIQLHSKNENASIEDRSTIELKNEGEDEPRSRNRNRSRSPSGSSRSRSRSKKQSGKKRDRSNSSDSEPDRSRHHHSRSSHHRHKHEKSSHKHKKSHRRSSDRRDRNDRYE